MKKNENGGQNLSTLFNEIEKVELTSKELDDQLIEYGFDPRELVRRVRERIASVKSNQNDNQPATEEFDPFLLAAEKSKRKKGPRRPRKND